MWASPHAQTGSCTGVIALDTDGNYYYGYPLNEEGQYRIRFDVIIYNLVFGRSIRERVWWLCEKMCNVLLKRQQ